MIGTKILASVLALGVIGGGAVGTNLVKPAAAVSQQEKAKEEKQDPNEQAKLQKEAAITKEQATNTVLQKYTDGTVKEVELEDEDGTVVYGVHVTAKDGKSYDVKVDAKTGKVTKSEDDSKDEQDNGKENEND
ncbi:PepSY domain-containing protein [Neobacillus sp. NPDC058068]|uniref:PepSY domain-containing protein n=1 Tax=Neobacillus sp. NPDC058068 TaxID=3346325 RepID=UPI0036DB6F6F